MSVRLLSIVQCLPQFLHCFKVFIVDLFLPNLLVCDLVIVNRIVSLISFSVYLSLVFRKAVDFCVLTLYSASLLKVFISSKNFLVDSIVSLV